MVRVQHPAKAAILCGTMLLASTTYSQPNDAFLGRWDLTVHGERGDYPSWLEVSRRAGSLQVQFVGPVGDAAMSTNVVESGGQLRFLVLKDPNEGKETDVQYAMHMVGDELAGSLHAPDGRAAEWRGVRAPDFRTTGDTAWGTSIPLFNGKNFDGWHFSGPQHANWVVRDGSFSNTGRGAELISDQTFRDFKLHLEFRCGPRSNSGVYLRGRYEVQLETNSAAEKPSHHTGGVYGFLAPRPEQPRKADMWQTYDMELVGRTLTVRQNGVTVIDHKEIPGITGGALDSREGEPGPIYLQGSEEGTTSFRNVVLTPSSN